MWTVECVITVEERDGKGSAGGRSIEAHVRKERVGAVEGTEVAGVGAVVEDTTDLDLVHRVQDLEDLKAYEILVKRYEKEALGLAYTLVGDWEEARDILQDSFFNLYRSIKLFRGESSFRTYFFRILVNRCRDAQRRRSVWGGVFLWRMSEGEEENLPEPVTVATPPETLTQSELGQKIDAAIKQLPWRQRTLFALKFIEGMKIREIAALTNLSEGTVKAHLFHAVSRMRKALEAYLKT